MSEYFFLRLKIKCGEYEFYSEGVHAVPKGTNIINFSETYAKEFYSTEVEEDDEMYYFNGGEVAVQISFRESISRQEYKVLSKFL